MSEAWRVAAETALPVLMSAGCDLADIFIEDTRTFRVRVEDGRVDQVSGGGDIGAGLRLVRGGQTWLASTNDISAAGLQATAAALIRAAQLSVGPVDPAKALNFGTAPVLGRVPDMPPPDRVAVALAAERAARIAGAHIRQVTVLLGGSTQRVGIARSDGTWWEDQRDQAMLWVNAVAEADGSLQTGFESAGGSSGWDFFRNHDAEGTGRLAGERAERMLTARPAPNGRFTVVLAAEAGGTMIHEAIGHALEADLVQKGMSVFAGKLGQQVASPLISVADDPTRAGWRGSYRVDDEGTPAQQTLLVERGILKSYLHDCLSARTSGEKPTGNGRRQSYAYRPIPRMSNTMILPGRHLPDRIIGSVTDGLLVKRMGGGQVNTVTGDFMFEVSDANWIRNGQVAEPVRGATLIGNGPQVLQSIDQVGSDHGQGVGTCGKEDQGVPVADAQPTLRIPEITVGGI